MPGAGVVEVVLVQVGVHPDPLLEELLVVLGAGQRREEEELQEVDRQLLLDHLDVAADALRRVVREAEDVARIGDDADVLPRQQHLAVFGDLVLLLLCRRRGCPGLMFSSPMNTRLTPARAAFSMKFGSRWQSVSTWMMKLDLELLDLAQVDQAVEDRLPVLVAGEVVVGDEEVEDALRGVRRARCARRRPASGGATSAPAR